MLLKINSLIEELLKIEKPEEFLLQKDLILLELKRVKTEYDKLLFKYERSSKEKNILSSLLIRTSADLKQVSDKLKIRAEELSTLLETIPAYVYFKDINLNYLIVNHAFVDLVGIPSDQITGKKIHDIFPGYKNEDFLNKEAYAVKTGTAFYDIEEEVEFNDRKRWVNSNIAPIRNAEDQIIGLIGISWDITDRKLNEVELRHSKELAEAGTLAKNEFIASISHEFRTPMNGILGLSEILKNSPLNPEQMDLLQGIIASAENLLVLLNDVLDFSAIEAGKMEMDYQPFMLERVMEDITLVMKMKAAEKNLGFTVVTEEEVPNLLIGDAQRLRQILINLTNNSVKFTEQGSIAVQISQVEKLANRVILRFEVTDTGIGIAPESIDSLFKVFSRIKGDKTKLISGTGLGLSICKKLCDLMGGQIGVESEPGKGSKFWFTLPFTLSNLERKLAPKIKMAITSGDVKKLILVAEDNAINQRIVSYHLQKMGFEVDLAGDGQEALEKYHQKQYDLIILDIQMPVMDGYKVARTIREEEKINLRKSAIIALTANAMKGDRELYLNAGMDGYVSKPFTFETLQEAINNVLR